LSVVREPISGDFNRDGQVDIADYTVWRDTFGQIGIHPAVDGDGDGIVTYADYTVWQSNFGASGTGATGSIRYDFIPEPTSFGFVILWATWIGAGHLQSLGTHSTSSFRP
jgi:hypothetical protein